LGVVSWNTAALLDRCLTALPGALAGLDAEIVVVDNASTDGSAGVASRHPGVQVIQNEANVGYAKAMNQALDGSEAPVLIALNPDAEPPLGSLAALVKELIDHPEAGLVVPRLVYGDGSRQHSVYRFPTVAVALVVSFVPVRLQRGWIGRRWLLEAASVPPGSGDIDWAIGAVHVIRASALAGRRPYSERWFMYVEDLELCWWLHQHGWSVRLAADIEVPHVGNAAGAQAWGTSRARRYWANTYDFDALARGGIHARSLAAVNVAGTAWGIVRCRVARITDPGGGWHHRVGAELRSLLPLHARVALGRPPPADFG
jgi:N-acetylglucosaminyl-diphospho-decaprenol L-rhamnosyltransferase